MLAHLFTPHHSNNQKPKLLHRQSLAILVAILLFTQAGIQIASRLYPNVLGSASQIPPETIIQLTNQKRAEAGVGPVTYNAQLADAARRKAADMFTKDYWAHNSPDGTKPWAFILAAGYNYLHAGENLARDFSDPGTVVNAWMASPTHKENLLNGRYDHIGVAVVDGVLGGQETTLVVQMFGTPQGDAPSTSTAGVQTSLAEPALAAEALPTPTPTLVVPTPTPNQETAGVYESDTSVEYQAPTINRLTLTKAVALGIAGLVTLVLAIDWYIAWQRNLIRISGRNWAHITFLLAVILIAILIKHGLII